MTGGGDKRKLTTILSLDMAGYSAASEHNQLRAIAYVGAMRDRAAALAQAEGGHIFNTAGDGLMLEFPIASGAVRAALTLAREAVAEPQKLPRIRAGVHLGEVIVDGVDRLGHGVNVAARLMQMAPPNGVVISDVVKSQLRGETDATFAPRGRVRLKKMREVIFAFEHLPGASLARRQWRRWRTPLLSAGAALALVGATLVGAVMATAPSETPFVAVLSFENLSGDPNLAYFSDGVSAEIQATLAQYQEGMRVAGLATSSQFHGREKDAAHVRQAMGATHVVDGSVRREGSEVRIVAELVDARNGAVVWTQTYDRAIAATLEAQSDIARHVGELLHAAAPDIAAPPAQMSPSALESYLRAVDLLEEPAYSSSAIDQQAIDNLEEATRSAPRFARAWALLSLAYARQSRKRNEDEQTALIARARDAALRAVLLDPHLALGEAMLARVEPEWNWETRRQHYQRALALAPHDLRVLSFWNDFLGRAGRDRDSQRVVEQSLQLDPLSEGAQRAVVGQLLDARDPEGAMRAAERLTTQNEAAAILWVEILSDRENANDLAGARRAQRELERHLPAIARNQGWSQQQENLMMAENHRDIALLEHGPPSEAELKRNAEAYYERVTGSTVGQGCVADMIPVVASNDRPDLAWRMIETLYLQKGYVGTTDTCNRPVYFAREAATWPLFATGTEQERRDPRIWRTFDAVGLTRYWRNSNQWPDFCGDRNLPYDCRAVAAQRR
jgi:adenylate cyclase